METDDGGAPVTYKLVRGAGRIQVAKLSGRAGAALFDAPDLRLVEEVESDVSEDDEDDEAARKAVPPWKRRRGWRGRRHQKARRWRAARGDEALLGIKIGGQSSQSVRPRLFFSSTLSLV